MRYGGNAGSRSVMHCLKGRLLPTTIVPSDRYGDPKPEEVIRGSIKRGCTKRFLNSSPCMWMAEA